MIVRARNESGMPRTDWPCVEFTHTRGWEERDRSDDDLESYGDLVAWSVDAGILDPGTARRLKAEADGAPDDAAQVVVRARALRTALYEVLTSVARDDAPPSGALARLNDALAAAGRHLGLAGQGRDFRLDFAPDARERLEFPLLAIARSAAELLTSSEVDRLKLCDAHDCGWLFIDASRNRSRRWCEMAECGNRAKVRRYRERHGD